MEPRKFNVSEFGYSIEQTFDTDDTGRNRAGGAYTPESQEQFLRSWSGHLHSPQTIAPCTG